MAFEEALVGLLRRFRLEFGGDDIEDVFEMAVNIEPPHHGVGMLAGAVGENQLAAGQLLECQAERGVGLERRVVDLMHEIEEVVRLHAVLGHQPAHRGAVAAVIVLLQPERLVMRDGEQFGDIVADAIVDLLPEIELMRVQRVVEIEDPGGDVGEAAQYALSVCRSRLMRGRCCGHGASLTERRVAFQRAT